MTWWEEFIPKRSVAIDVGANVGFYVKPLCDRAELAYFIEPSPACFKWLSHNSQGVLNASCHRLAFGTRRMTQQVFYHRHWTLLPFSETDPRYLDREFHPAQDTDLKNDFEAEYVRMDEFIAQHVRPHGVGFVMIDVDGAEYQVLAGAPTMLEEDRPAIYVEIGRTNMAKFSLIPEQLLALLRFHEYEFVLDDYGSPRRMTSQKLATMLPVGDNAPNVLCLPAEHPALREWTLEDVDA